jgi:hypothetical protein
MLFAIVFLWQFPHFMAIAWMYREDYTRAGYLVLPLGKRRIVLSFGKPWWRHWRSSWFPSSPQLPAPRDSYISQGYSYRVRSFFITA